MIGRIEEKAFLKSLLDEEEAQSVKAMTTILHLNIQESAMHP